MDQSSSPVASTARSGRDERALSAGPPPLEGPHPLFHVEVTSAGRRVRSAGPGGRDPSYDHIEVARSRSAFPTLPSSTLRQEEVGGADAGGLLDLTIGGTVDRRSETPHHMTRPLEPMIMIHEGGREVRSGTPGQFYPAAFPEPPLLLLQAVLLFLVMPGQKGH